MAQSIGLLELRSIPPGYQAADEMLDAADVTLLMATPICPGKFVVVISGHVGAVKTALPVGCRTAGEFLISSQIIENVHPDIPAALMGTSNVTDIRGLGFVETMTAITSIRAADIAAKSANVQLMEIRIARGLGGKGYVVFTGDISPVKTALAAVLAELKDTGDITSTAGLTAPDPQIVALLS